MGMKWFKHLSKSRHDQDLQDAFELFGPWGHWVFWNTLEIIAEDFNVDNPGTVQIKLSTYLRQLRMRRDRAIKILNFWASRPIHRKPKRIEYQIFKNQDGIEMIRLESKKMKDLADNWTKKHIK